MKGAAAVGVGGALFGRLGTVASASTVPGIVPSVETSGDLPDLILTELVFPASITAGDQVVFGCVVKNQGAGSTPAGTPIGASFNVDGAAVSWVGTDDRRSLAPGASVTLTARSGPTRVAYWTAVAGTHRLVATVDGPHRIAESDETNNKLTASITVAESASTSLLWSVGDTVAGATTTDLYKETPNVAMVSQWYNGPNDITDYLHAGYAPGGNARRELTALWSAGKAVELVIYPNNGTDDRPSGSGTDSTTTTTPGMEYSAYALTDQCVTDVANLVSWFSTDGSTDHPCYVVLFTEFQGGTYPLPSGYTETSWEAALMEQVPRIVAAAHAVNPQAKVGLGLAGYAYTGGAQPDFGSYTTAIEASDVVWCQDMQSYLSLDSEGRCLVYQAAINFAQTMTNSGLAMPWGVSHSQIYGGPETYATLADGIGAVAAGTSQTIAASAVAGSLFPALPFYATLYSSTTDTSSSVEQVQVTACTDGSCTVTRGNNGVVNDYAAGSVLVYCCNPDYVGTSMVDQLYNANGGGEGANFQAQMLCNQAVLGPLMSSGLFAWNLMVGIVSGPSGQDAGAWFTYPGPEIGTLSSFIDGNACSPSLVPLARS